MAHLFSNPYISNSSLMNNFILVNHLGNGIVASSGITFGNVYGRVSIINSIIYNDLDQAKCHQRGQRTMVWRCFFVIITNAS